MKTYHGSCDCGKVRFEIGLDLEAGTFKCNCRMCSKIRFWGIAAKTENFKLISGAEDLTMYGVRKIHRFCKHCGTKIFGGPADDDSRMVVSVAALDDLTQEELDQISRTNVRFADGRNDNWKESPKHTAHL